MSLSYSFRIDQRIEVKLRKFIHLKSKEEISGGLIGDLKGSGKNNLLFDIKEFMPFPNLAEDKSYFAEPPEIWFDIIEEWRLFYFNDYKFLGFIHTHTIGTSKMSEQDIEFANLLQEKYGSIIFIIISENLKLRCYLFNQKGYCLIQGNSKIYQILKK